MKKTHVNMIENISLLLATVLLIASIAWGALIGDHHIEGSVIPSWMAAVAIIIVAIFISERFFVGIIKEAISLKEKIQEMKENKEIMFSKIMYCIVFFGIFPAIAATLITVATGILKLPVQDGYFADNIIHTPFSWWQVALLFVATTMMNAVLILKSFGWLDLKLSLSFVFLLIFLLSGCSQDNKFESKDSFDITIPSDYSSNGEITALERMTHRERLLPGEFTFNYVCEDFFKTITYSEEPVPGSTYQVEIFKLKKGKEVSREECVEFLKTKRSHFFGTLGMSFLWKNNQKELDKFSKRALYLFPYQNGDILPAFEKTWVGPWNLVLMCHDCKYSVEWEENVYLVGFFEK